jgi:hypothetical protein
VRSEPKIRIPLEDRLVPRKLDLFPALTSREITGSKPSSLPLTSRYPKALLLSTPLIERSKKNLLLMKELGPVRAEPESSSEGSRILRRL